MKKILFLLILITAFSCKEAVCDCKSFKTGKFQFVQKIDGIEKTTIFERTADLQIETYEGKTDTASVRWVNDCEFVLKKLRPRNMKEQKAISMRILSTDEKSYRFEYSFVGSEKKEKGVATKVEQIYFCD